MKCKLRQITSMFLSMMIVLTLVQPLQTSAATLPKPTAPVTLENILAILNKYDPDGADFIKNSAESGGHFDPLAWWNAGDSILDAMNTAVHEECHHYTTLDYQFYENTYTRCYRISTKKDYEVKWNKSVMVFSNEMAERITSSFRGERYDTYIGGYDVRFCDANQFGVYGLLNEFNAYGWGFNNDLCMYNYLKDVKGKSYAKNWLIGNGSQINAYSEFKYWFYRYLLHAKNYYPDVYRSIGENKDFIKAYSTVENRFAKAISKYLSLTKESLPTYYNKIEKELKKTKYKEIDQILKGQTVDLSSYTWDHELQWVSIANIEPSDKGVSFFWNEVPGADGYKIYRRTDSGEKTLIDDITDIHYTDSNVVYGKHSYYHVVPYKNQPNEEILEGVPSLERSIYLVRTPKISKLSLSNGKIKTSWGKIASVSGYEIQFKVITSNSSNGKPGDPDYWAHTSYSSTSYIVSKNKQSCLYAPPYGKNQEYFVSVRAYQIIDGITYYSKWSPEKTIKI